MWCDDIGGGGTDEGRHVGHISETKLLRVRAGRSVISNHGVKLWMDLFRHTHLVPFDFHLYSTHSIQKVEIGCFEFSQLQSVQWL